MIIIIYNITIQICVPNILVVPIVYYSVYTSNIFNYFIK